MKNILFKGKDHLPRKFGSNKNSYFLQINKILLKKYSHQMYNFQFYRLWEVFVLLEIFVLICIE